MVGFRVFDVGLLIVWLVWFFRMRDDEVDPPDDDGGGGGGGGPKPKAPRLGPGGGGLRLPLGRWPMGKGRPRNGRRPSRSPERRRHAPSLPRPLPARVRSPRAPSRVTRRS